MAGFEKELYEIARTEVKKVLENEADKIKRQMVKATKEALADYYRFPEGKYYDRTYNFLGNSFTPVEEKNISRHDINSMFITVGVFFECGYEYEHAGVDTETIYTWNLELGQHGGNGTTTPSPLDAVTAFRDSIATD